MCIALLKEILVRNAFRPLFITASVTIMLLRQKTQLQFVYYDYTIIHCTKVHYNMLQVEVNNVRVCAIWFECNMFVI